MRMSRSSPRTQTSSRPPHRGRPSNAPSVTDDHHHDGPVHHDLRRAFDGNLRPKKVEAYVDHLVRPIAARHVAALNRAAAAGEPVDLLGEYFEPISVLSLAAVLGLAATRTPCGAGSTA